MNTRQDRRRVIGLLAALGLAAGVLLFSQRYLSRHGPTYLSWTPPAVSESGGPITNLAGYTIHCWSEGGRHTYSIRIDDPSVTHYEIESFPSGRYQCAVSAYTRDGLESALSDFVARTVE